MKNILVVGSIAYDTIETPSGRVESVIGGSANYFSLAASLYSSVRVVGVVGKDYSAEDLKVLSDRKVNLEGLTTEEGKTFRWSGHYIDSLNEAVTLRTDLNVFKDFNPRLPESYKNSDVVFLANIDPVLQMKVLDQVTSPKVVGLDTMNFWIDSKLKDLKSAIERVHILLLNETEARKLTGTQNIVEATQKLISMGPQTVVVKRGEYGFFMLSQGQYFVLPAFPVKQVVDPTGAGDTFAGGFFGYLSRCTDPLEFRNLQTACVHGAVIASYCVQDFSVGAIKKLNWTDVETRMNEYLKVVSLAP